MNVDSSWLSIRRRSGKEHYRFSNYERFEVKKVFVVDLDHQENLSYSFGAQSDEENAIGVLRGKIKPFDVIVDTHKGDIIPRGRSLAGADAFYY